MTIKSFLQILQKQISAAMFGIFLLLLMIITKYYFPFSSSIHRYDFIFLSAVMFQVFLIVFKFETKNEVFVILIFHILATFMELFKTSDAIGAWHYPEEYIFGINNVPLFAGFMYSAVGSYIARAWKIFEIDFIDYPKIEYSMILSILIYINFFTHHYVYDIRWFLLATSMFLFYKTYIKPHSTHFFKKIYLLIVWFFVSVAIWIGENIATYANIWLYPNQELVWQMVSFQKIISWYLLMILSFVLISTIKLVKNSSIFENYIKFGSLGYMAFIFVVIINLNLGIISHKTLYFLKFIPGHDYTARVVIFFMLTFVLNVMLKYRPIKIVNIKLFLGTIFAILFVTFEELSQIWLPNRVFDLADIFFSYIGIILACVTVKSIRQKSNFKQKATE